mmetsp:Transcript_12730/g.33795  ORF Transcript_12730/g.33795 Transcript_12730/m.33795 type:complete len:231 (-) Transcript_12730:252-944(-)
MAPQGDLVPALVVLPQLHLPADAVVDPLAHLHSGRQQRLPLSLDLRVLTAVGQLHGFASVASSLGPVSEPVEDRLSQGGLLARELVLRQRCEPLLLRDGLLRLLGSAAFAWGTRRCRRCSHGACYWGRLALLCRAHHLIVLRCHDWPRDGRQHDRGREIRRILPQLHLPADAPLYPVGEGHFGGEQAPLAGLHARVLRQVPQVRQRLGLPGRQEVEDRLAERLLLRPEAV